MVHDYVEVMLLPSTARSLRHRLVRGQVLGRAPSMAGAVVRGTQPIWSHVISTTLDTQFRIGSLTKTFVAILVMRLRDEGSLNLEDRIDRYLEGTRLGDLTVGQVLAHTSGLSAESPGPWWERTPGTLRPTLDDVLGDEPIKHPAGECFHYSNTGYAALGGLIETIRAKSWTEVLHEEILSPLGMSRTGAVPTPPCAQGWSVHPWADVVLPEVVVDVGLMSPAGQMWSTIDDLCRFAGFLLGNGGKVLRAETLAEIRAPRVAPSDVQWTTNYGLGLQVRRSQGRVLSGHTGSMPGFVCALWVDPEEQLGSVVLTNTTANVPVGTLTAELLHLVADNEPFIPEYWRPATNIDSSLLTMAGVWYWGPSPYSIRVQQDNILELMPLLGRGGRGAQFIPQIDGIWLGKNGYFAGETLKPIRDKQSGALSHLDIGSFIFTREPYEPSGVIPGGVAPDGWG